MKILRSIDVYTCISKAIVISQRANFLGCVFVDNKYELHECRGTMELLEELNKGKKIFSVLHGVIKIHLDDTALKLWTVKQIEITNAILRVN